MAASGKQVGGRAFSYLTVRRGCPPAFCESGRSTLTRSAVAFSVQQRRTATDKVRILNIADRALRNLGLEDVKREADLEAYRGVIPSERSSGEKRQLGTSRKRAMGVCAGACAPTAEPALGGRHGARHSDNGADGTEGPRTVRLELFRASDRGAASATGRSGLAERARGGELRLALALVTQDRPAVSCCAADDGGAARQRRRRTPLP